MNRLPALAPRTAAAAAAVLLVPLWSMPTIAQDQAGDRVNQVIIFGDDECPQSEGNTITVCARLDESERYRIPPRLRQSGSPDNESWTRRVESLEAVGEFGPLSCTPAGAGGELGCTVEMIQRAYDERAQGRDVRMAELIAQARGERLAEIEGDAAAYQARVEELERIEFERRAAAQGAALPGEDAQGEAEEVDPDGISATPPPLPGEDD